jgi:hypothetical protein
LFPQAALTVAQSRETIAGEWQIPANPAGYL